MTFLNLFDHRTLFCGLSLGRRVIRNILENATLMCTEVDQETIQVLSMGREI